MLATALVAVIAAAMPVGVLSTRASAIALDEVIIVDSRRPSITAQLSGTWSSLAKVRATIDGRTVRATTSGNTVTVTAPSLRDGTHVLEVGASSRVPGLSARTERAQLIVDTAAPETKVTIDQRRLDSERAEVIVTVDTDERTSVEVQAGSDRVELQTNKGRAVHRLTLFAGAQQVQIVATDPAGNRSTRTEGFSVDVTPPVIRMEAPQATYETNEPTFRASVTDDQWALGVRVVATIDGRPARAHRSGRTVLVRVREPLSEGRHEMSLAVSDAAGNTTTTQHELLVDSSDVLGQATLREGARGPDVRLLQQELMRVGTLDSATLSALYDASTMEAVKEFQSSEGLDVDGVAGPFTIAALTLRIEIDQSEHKLVLHRYGRPWRTYSIAVGQPKYPTPNGDFRIVDKQKNPTWTPPDSEWAKDAKVTPPGPDNPLGTRWMGLDAPTIGIHGTNSPESLGYSVSHGCIRMSITDVEHLYDIVDEGTRVRIRP